MKSHHAGDHTLFASRMYLLAWGRRVVRWHRIVGHQSSRTQFCGSEERHGAGIRRAHRDTT